MVERRREERKEAFSLAVKSYSKWFRGKKDQISNYNKEDLSFILFLKGVRLGNLHG